MKGIALALIMLDATLTFSGRQSPGLYRKGTLLQGNLSGYPVKREVNMIELKRESGLYITLTGAI